MVSKWRISGANFEEGIIDKGPVCKRCITRQMHIFFYSRTFFIATQPEQWTTYPLDVTCSREEFLSLFISNWWRLDEIKLKKMSPCKKTSASALRISPLIWGDALLMGFDGSLGASMNICLIWLVAIWRLGHKQIWESQKLLKVSILKSLFVQAACFDGGDFKRGFNLQINFWSAAAASELHQNQLHIGWWGDDGEAK